MNAEISLRDYFAGLAMQQFIAEGCQEGASIEWDSIPRDSYLMADAMLKARGGVLKNDPGSDDIDRLELTKRTELILRGFRVDSISTLQQMTELDLMKLPGLGNKSLREVRDSMQPYGGLKAGAKVLA